MYGENTYRRLRENKLDPNPTPALQVIFEGSAEVRESLIGATIIGIIVLLADLYAPWCRGADFYADGDCLFSGNYYL